MSRTVFRAFVALTLLRVASAQSPLVTFPFHAEHIVVHPTTSIAYASVPDQGTVVVIDTESLALVSTIPVGAAPHGLCLTPAGDELVVCVHGTQSLTVIDTHSQTIVRTLPMPWEPFDVQVGLGGRAYVTADGLGPYHGILQVDVSSGAVQDEFSFNVFTYYQGMMALSPDRQRLYFGNRDISPGDFACFDVSTPTASLVWKNPFGTLGGNGQDLAVSADGAFVSYATGSGNFNYDVFKISTTTFASVGSFHTGPYPREIVYSRDGTVAYTAHANQIDLWDANTFQALAPIPTAALPRNLTLDRTGRRIFAVVNNQTLVYPTGFGAGLVTTFCAGDGSGTACPCGNSGSPGRGCDNSLSTGGALLSATGFASVSTDTLVLTTVGLPSSTAALYFQGDSLPAHGAGVLYGDGLRCAGGSVRRLGTLDTGSGHVDYPQVGNTPISTLGGVPASAASTRYYQLWYRNSIPFCTPATFNLSNALGVAWTP